MTMLCISRLRHRALAASLLVLLGPGAAQTQGTALSFSGLQAVSGQPVEVRAESLTVDNATGETVFSGDAVLGQGALRLSADTIRVLYRPGDTARISRLEAEGSVTLVTAREAAEAARAVYDVSAGTVSMRGDVILTQGPNVLSGDRLDVDLRRGTGRMEGRVRSLIQTDR